jgi:hypothetical protein
MTNDYQPEQLYRDIKTLKEDLKHMDDARESARETTNQRLTSMENEIRTVRIYLLGNGHVENSVMFKLTDLCKDFKAHLDFHKTVERGVWDTLRPVLVYLMTTGLGGYIAWLILRGG